MLRDLKGFSMTLNMLKPYTSVSGGTTATVQLLRLVQGPQPYILPLYKTPPYEKVFVAKHGKTKVVKN